MRAKVNIDIANTEKLVGKGVKDSKKTMSQLIGVFKDEEAFKAADQDQVVYEVQAYMPVEEGKKGGLFWGNSMVYPGKVGTEYHMTRGHFHSNLDTGEYYWCLKGEGALIMMDLDRNCWYEEMKPGTLHYIPGNVSHRVANTGYEPLFFNACWPSDAGHDYASIEKEGFAARLFEVDGKPQLIKE
ncbi:glucose-6-phosphate isomerase family protein [Marinilabilia rubra]|uniref:glucose-6-phosphate isomerase n=1 Tax=Marinilabilia rubra TaxID=2162893 RepID=A0A2U2BC15_9BACT|nr:glucose-6-phosphate isomerase family protein [Marinilabilia rubra]PWE00609.1 glucose-6-phosphate isomerase [Marinilabilia rubra]